MNKALRIGVVTDQLLPGGVQLAAIEQVKELNKQGHQAKLIILMKRQVSKDYSYLVKDIPHQYLSDSYPRIFQKTIKFPIFRFFSTLHLTSPLLAPKVIKKGSFDILVGLGSTTCLTCQQIFRKNEIPYIAVIHDPISYILEKVYSTSLLKIFFPIIQPIIKIVEGSYLKEAKKVLIISSVHEQFIKDEYSIQPEILGFGVKDFGKLPLKRGANLLSFGRWDKQKNPELLLDLIKQIPNAKLIIAGSWTSDSELRNFQKELIQQRLKQRVELITHYSSKSLKQLAAKSRLFVYPSFEAFGLAALEAASLGLPIIMPSKSGVTEYFKHEVHGFFPKKNDLYDYKKYILPLLKNERLAYEMGQSGASLVKDKFSWSENSKQLLEIIYSALKLNVKPRIVVLETGHAKGLTLAGGDKLMEPMAVRLFHLYDFSIIVPQIGSHHWKTAPLEKELIILPKNIFDQSVSATSMMLNYFLRMFQTTKILKESEYNFYYSSTDLLSDILPVYIVKKYKYGSLWIARVHHLIPSPFKRQGNILVNSVTYFMQAISFWMMKKRADMILVLNDKLKKQLIKRGLPQKKLTTLGGGIDFNKIASLKILPNTEFFEGVFLGRYHKTKGIFDLVPIWGGIVKDFSQARIAVIGTYHESTYNTLKEQIEKANLTKNIILLGFVSEDKLFSILKKAKVFVFTDHEAGFGLAVAEAMACGLPVVGYDNGVLGSVYKRGYLEVPMLDYEFFSKKIIQIIKSPRLQKKLAVQALQEASKLDWNNTIKKFINILDNMISPNS